MQNDDRYLDDAIDRTVRDMLDVDPPAGLERRVLAQIEGTAIRRGWTFPRVAVVTALAAAAVVLAIATLFRPVSRDVPLVATTAPEPASRQPVTPAVPATSPAVAVPHPDLARAVSQPRRAASANRQVEAANVAADGDIAIAPLTPMDPIRFAPLGPPAIAVAAIGTDSIQVAPLRLDPLSSTPQ